jgi:hypothetical protein
MLSIILVVTVSSTSRIVKERSSHLGQAMHLSLEMRNLPSLFITLPEGDGNYLNIVEEKSSTTAKIESLALPNDRCILNSLPLSFKL